jgi:hypothetical protein
MKAQIHYFILFIFILIGINIIAQEPDTIKKDISQKKPESTNWVFGGNFSLAFGTVTFVDISPLVGFYIRPKLLVGAGATYQYLSGTYILSSDYSSVRVRSNIFGFRTFVNYTFFETSENSFMNRNYYGFFVHAEYEALNLDHDFSNTASYNSINRFWINGILLGGGIKQLFGRHSAFSITVLDNILASSKTPYDNPVVRIGFLF